MWEFLTEWSYDDPKWLAVFIIVGGWVAWSGYKYFIEEQKNPSSGRTFRNIVDIGRTIAGFLIFLYGLIGLSRRLFTIMF